MTGQQLPREASSSEAQPFAAPCAQLDADAPLRWLAAGWRDLRAAPGPSLASGLVVMILSWVVVGIGWKLGSYWSALVLLSGFVFVAPVLALGLYSISRQLATGTRPSLARCFAEKRHRLPTAMVFSLALLVVFLVWARAASMLHVFFPMRGNPALAELLPFLAIGSVVGSIFALMSFSISAFSLPMICDREADAVTAVVSSINAVLRNKRAMAVWVVLIVALTGLGFATAMVGLVVTMPLLGYATWHGYRETIDAAAWPLAGER